MKILTGMHRSGTSFLSQAVAVRGGDFGDPSLLFPADKWNKNGYFESIPCIEINNRLILGKNVKISYWLEAPEQSLKRLFNAIKSKKWKYFFFPHLDKIHRRSVGEAENISRISDFYEKKFVKDPRFCLTISPWSNYGNIESITFSFRHPSAVAGSLKRREGLPLWFGYKYWIYHVSNFLTHCPEGIPVLFVNFDRCLNPETSSYELKKLSYLNISTQNELNDLDNEGIVDLKLVTQKNVNSIRFAPKHANLLYNRLRHYADLSEQGFLKVKNNEFHSWNKKI
jgi:hypothetical protein